MKITAYLKPVCGWSGGVRDVFAHYGLDYEEKLISEPVMMLKLIPIWSTFVTLRKMG